MRLFEGTQFDIPPKCDRCDELESDCQCPPETPVVEHVPRDKQQLKVYPEKRKHGRIITCVKYVDQLDRSEALTALKNKFGCGGTIKNDVIELQGDHVFESKQLLKQLGFRLK